MKKIIIAVLVAVALGAASNSFAQASNASSSSDSSKGVYAYFGVGLANMAINQSELDTTSAAVGNAAPSTVSNSGTGFNFGAGYQFNPYFGAEFSYSKFGSPAYDNPSPGPTVGVTFTPRSYDVLGVVTIPMGSHFAVYGKAGVAFTKLDASTNELQQYTTSASTTNFAGGGGLRINVNQNFGIFGEYIYHGTAGVAPDFVNNVGTGTGSLGLLSFGVSVHFPM